MNIKILDSWLREYLDTKATPLVVAEKLSLTSVSVERVEPFGKNDVSYDIEVTTNRPDLMSVIGLAREAAAVLPQFDIPAKFREPSFSELKPHDNLSVQIENDPSIVNRVCYAILEVTQKESPAYVKERLEAAGIRSLNNLVDITNYVMLEVGHPTHVFDYDRLTTKKLVIRQSKKGEKIVNLDGKEHILPGGDIVADDGTGKIIDLLGIMGTANSIVVNGTKRILFFIDNNEPSHIRKTSMSLGIRTDAASLNEKGVDPELAAVALKRGVQLYHELAEGILLSKYIDLYPNKPKSKKVSVSFEKINSVLGIEIPKKTSIGILTRLGFKTSATESKITAEIPTSRLHDIDIGEDLIEEIARVYGYHNLPSELPPISLPEITNLSHNPFYWEQRVKSTLKYWGFTEVYTYSMVSEDLYEGPVDEAVTIDNPLSTDWVYMRKTLVPSLLQVLKENKEYKKIKLFEIGNVYKSQPPKLPQQSLMLAGIVQDEQNAFYEVKGILEQLFTDLGVEDFDFRKKSTGGLGADVYIGKDHLGEIEVLDEDLVDFELNFEKLTATASLKKTFTPLSKYPAVLEDISLVVNEDVETGEIIKEIKKESNLIVTVELLDMYQNSRTFHIVYQAKDKNLTNEEVGEIREKILKHLKQKFQAEVK